MKTGAEEYKHSAYLDEHKVVVVFSSSRAGEMIDLLFSAGATICNMGYADCSQVAEIVKIMRKNKILPS